MQGNRRARGAVNLKQLRTIDKGVLKRLLAYLKHYKKQAAVVLAGIIISSASGVASSLFLGMLIDRYIMPMIGQAAPDYSGLIRALIVMALIYLAGIVASLMYNRSMAVIGQGVLKTVRDDMFAHMQTLPIKYFDTHPFGDVMSRYTNDTDTLRQLITQSIPTTIQSAMTILFVVGSMLYTSVYLTLFIFVCLIGMLQVTKRVTGASGKYFARQQKELGSVNAYIEEIVGGQKVVKVFTHEKACAEEFDKRNGELFEVASRANTYASILGPIMNNMGYFLYAFIAIAGGALALSGIGNLSLTGIAPLTLGSIAAFLQLSRNFLNPINQLSQQLNVIVMAMAGAGRIFELMDEKEEPDNGYVTLVNVTPDGKETQEHTGMWAWKHPHGDGTTTYTRLKGEVTLDHVDFGYNEDHLVLHDITLYALEGQKVAFVGATGAGKTTITNLINRFYDIADGKIRYDAININKIKKPALRKSLGVVLQDVNLFTGTVMDNIRYGKLDATDEECIDAAKRVNADSFIRMLPQGYDTMLESDGANLSQGQRQLLSIARAAVADPPVMILDEATSSIDTRTEALVQKGMDALMQGRTVFVIAHRLSTVMNADVIMVLEHGHIIERGSHDQLIAQKGKYYQLYTGAFELE